MAAVSVKRSIGVITRVVGVEADLGHALVHVIVAEPRRATIEK